MRPPELQQWRGKPPCICQTSHLTLEWVKRQAGRVCAVHTWNGCLQSSTFGLGLGSAPSWDQALHLSSLMGNPAFQDSARCRLCCQAGATLPSDLSKCLSAASHHLLVLVLSRPLCPLNWLLPAMHGLYMPGLNSLCGQEHRMSVNIMTEKHDVPCASTSHHRGQRAKEVLGSGKE